MQFRPTWLDSPLPLTEVKHFWVDNIDNTMCQLTLVNFTFHFSKWMNQIFISLFHFLNFQYPLWQDTGGCPPLRSVRIQSWVKPFWNIFLPLCVSFSMCHIVPVGSFRGRLADYRVGVILAILDYWSGDYQMEYWSTRLNMPRERIGYDPFSEHRLLICHP